MMSSALTSSFTEESARLGSGSGSRLSSQRFDSARYESFADYADGEPMSEGSLEEEFPPNIGAGMVEPIPQSDRDEFVGNGPILPPPAEMEAEEVSALREWRRLNTIRLEEKEKMEKAMVKGIIAEADDFKTEYYKKWNSRCENRRAANREKEELFLASREKFHSEANKAYWKGIAELVPNEVPVIEKKGKKTPSIVVIQGPKPGKPTDLSRMRQVLVKLKHKPPAHMVQSSPPVQVKDAESQCTTPDAASTTTLDNQAAVSSVAN